LLIRAAHRRRWSGHYYVDATIWMHAHWTQVTEPGWKILGVEGGGSGYLDGGWQNGMYVTVTDGSDFSVILERLHCQRCARPLARVFSLGCIAHTDFCSPAVVRLELAHLPTTKPLSLWRTNAQGYFQRDEQALSPSGGVLTLALDAASIYSLTTVTTVS